MGVTMWRFWRPAARPPTNVQIHYADGSTLAAECRYAGWDDGTHVWVVVNARPGIIPRAISVDTLPGRTSVVITDDPDRLVSEIQGRRCA